MPRDHIHFLGVYGHAMRGVAAAAKELGHKVTGTDQGENTSSPPAEWLKNRGITTWSKPDPGHLEGVSRVVIGGRIEPSDPELKAARRKKIPVVSFPELVGDLSKGARRIVVAGTHGKTTITSLLAWVFETAGQNPDFLIGIKPHNFESSVRLTGGRIAILEGDEYQSSRLDNRSKFMHYHPDVLVLTSLEHDHPDVFPDFEAVRKRFQDLIEGIPAAGRIVFWNGSEATRDLVASFPGDKQSYHFGDADWGADQIRYDAEGIRFNLKHHQEGLGELKVPLFGEHNVLNSVGAAAAALEEGIALEDIARAFMTFKGASRRFERISGPDAKITVLDDYAHHPTEARATIQAAKLHFPGRVIAVYQPHTYSRTKELLEDYHQAFTEADQTFITKIERVHEPEATVSGDDIARGAGKTVSYIEDRDKLLAAVTRAAKPGDTILSMSVSGNDDFAQDLAAKLVRR